MKIINSDIKKSKTIDAEFYTSEILFKKSIDDVFARNWQFICDLEVLDQHGSAFPFYFIENILPEPLFIINNQGKLHCFSNVCTHRGNLLINSSCKIKRKIRCSYHGREFDICGKFKFMPMTKGMEDFPTSNDDLTEIPLAKWKQFVFTSLSPAYEFNDLIKNLDERVGWMPIEDFKFRQDLSKEYFINANWALYCDNYLEGFHIPFVHDDLNTVLDAKNYDVETFKFSSLQIGIADDNEICFDLPIDSKYYGKQIAAFYFWLFPNLMLNFYPWGLSINIITPISVNETKIEFKSYVWDEKKLNIGAGANLDKVEMEDEEVVQNVQKGVVSRYYKYGRFSPTMEQGVHHFHRLISQFMSK